MDDTKPFVVNETPRILPGRQPVPRGAAVLARIAITCVCLSQVAFADLYMKGKVTLENGTPPPSRVVIKRICPAGSDVTVGTTNRRGEFIWHAQTLDLSVCYLRAVLTGYISTQIDLSDDTLFWRPELPPLVLHERSSADVDADEVSHLPGSAAKYWNRAIKSLAAQKWAEAERQLRATVRAAPDFAAGWSSLGAACQHEQKTTEARDAYRRAIDADPKLLPALVNLTRLDITSQDWSDAAKRAGALIKFDTSHLYAEAYLEDGIALYFLNDLDQAAAILNEGLRLDQRNQAPRLEFFMGATLAAKGNHEGASAHLRKYLEHAPDSDDTAAVKEYLTKLATARAGAAVRIPVRTEGLAQAADFEFPDSGEAWVPGGLRALSSLAGLKTTPSYDDFFRDYSSAVVSATSAAGALRNPAYAATFRAYMDAVAELPALGERRGEATVATLSLADPAHAAVAEHVLSLIGWNVVNRDGAARVELGIQDADGPRQRVAAALGIDELAMQQALDAGRSYQIEVRSENARLRGGAAWTALLAGFVSLPGGLAEAFALDQRFAKTYAGLAAMPADAAAALVKGVGLRNLVLQHSEAVWLYADAFHLASGAVAVPGGAGAQNVWSQLAKASPRDPPSFLRAVLTTDGGRLAALYSALWHGDEKRQRFFTQTAARLRRFYAWYRDSDELRAGIGKPARAWRASFFAQAPLDDEGSIRFPGGKPAWTTSNSSGDDALFTIGSFEALMAVARLEEKRGKPVDAVSAALLAQNFAEWRDLFPFFETMPDLSGGDFQALAKFSRTVAAYPRREQNLVMGEWDALTELIRMGRAAGSLDAAQSARAFRRICEELSAGDAPTHPTILLRDLVGDAADLDDAVVSGLLRLEGAHRVAFDRVRRLQGAPGLNTLAMRADPENTLTALAGVVYAATLNPDSLLVSEDPALLRKQQYVPEPCSTCSSAAGKLRLFSPARLLASSDPPGSRVIGGFVGFDKVAQSLLDGGRAPDPPLPIAPAEAAGSTPVPEATFRTGARLVEVYTTVTDDRGRYVDGLKRDQFTILDDGKPVPVAVFENDASAITCALLLDTTGSMAKALPALESAAMRLIGGLRADDAVGVYSLSSGVSELQGFTTDKTAALRSVLRTEPGGGTALYDGVVRVVRDLSGRAGKKIIVVLTDGEDNLSTLTADAAIARAKGSDVAIYTIALGDALRNTMALSRLTDIAQSTGGIVFAIRSEADIARVFEAVLQDILHGYLLAFRPAPAKPGWRPIAVVLHAQKRRKVRSREGYFPE